jgi:hypothetical protein
MPIKEIQESPQQADGHLRKAPYLEAGDHLPVEQRQGGDDNAYTPAAPAVVHSSRGIHSGVVTAAVLVHRMPHHQQLPAAGFVQSHSAAWPNSRHVSVVKGMVV